MKWIACLSGFLLGTCLFAAEPVETRVNKADGSVIVEWQGGSGVYQVEASPDLRTWRPVGFPTRATAMELPLALVQEGEVSTEPGTISGNPPPQVAPTPVMNVIRVGDRPSDDMAVALNAGELFHEGRQIYRFDTFGSEAFWGGTLRLHEAIAGTANGGVGPGLSPRAALALGLKVDSAALPTNVLAALAAGQVNLDEPTNTLALLQLNAVVGVTGFFTNNVLGSMGIQCALCHSTVNDSVGPGIGTRLDGWPNRDLNVGAIVALAPDKSFFTNHFELPEADIVNILTNWGPGRYDAELILDGKGFRPDGKTAATLLPAAFGLAGVNLHTYTGWGSIAHWNAYVANIAMQGQGTFYDPRLNDTNKFPLAVKAGLFNIRKQPDLVTSKLPALHLYQIAIPAPTPPTNSFDAAAATRGEILFNGAAQCATCHVPPLYTEPGWPMHTPEEIGIDDFQANRSPDGMYRTTPLRGLFTRQKGGFYHDGRFATLPDVVNHYDTNRTLNLTQEQKNDLIEFLKSL
jgi:cytochrome c peroxidase